MCDKQSNEFFKNLIYKNTVVIFGDKDDEYSQQSSKLFQEKFNHDAKMIDINNLNSNLKMCLKHRIKSNEFPIIYINGMQVGGYNKLINMDERGDLNIFF